MHHQPRFLVSSEAAPKCARTPLQLSVRPGRAGRNTDAHQARFAVNLADLK
jgi:hypothetical protein